MKRFIVTILVLVTCMFVWTTPLFADGDEGGWVDPQKAPAIGDNGQPTTPCITVPTGNNGTSTLTIMDYLGISPIIQVAVVEIASML